MVCKKILLEPLITGIQIPNHTARTVSTKVILIPQPYVGMGNKIV